MPDTIGNWLKGATLVLAVFLASIGGIQYFNDARLETQACAAETRELAIKNSQRITTIESWVQDNKEMPSNLARIASVLERIDKRMDRLEDRLMGK